MDNVSNLMIEPQRRKERKEINHILNQKRPEKRGVASDKLCRD
jgi:hypothetical protein